MQGIFFAVGLFIYLTPAKAQMLSYVCVYVCMYVPLQLTFEHLVRSENKQRLFPQRTTELCLDDGQVVCSPEGGH